MVNKGGSRAALVLHGLRIEVASPRAFTLPHHERWKPLGWRCALGALHEDEANHEDAHMMDYEGVIYFG